MPLANYTTKIEAAETIAEIQKMLASFGANSISLHYENGKASAIDFVLKLDGYPLRFLLPQSTAAAHKVLSGQRVKAYHRTVTHAESVSWRILRDWVRAQLAMVELKQAEIAQVFMPYAMVADQPVYKTFREQRMKQLGSGE